MKKLLFLAGLILLAASCSKESVEQVINEQAVAPVTVAVSGFTVEQGDFPGTRATPVGSYSDVKTLTLAFYRIGNGDEVYKHTQYRNNLSEGETFGEFSTTLPLGNYTMVVLASGNSNGITLTSPTTATYGENTVKDTFAATQSVNITSANAVNLNATLNRIVTAVAVQSTDNRPAEVTHMRFTYSAGGKSFSPSTGLATVNTGFATTAEYSSGTVGHTTFVGGYLFLASDTQTMDVTIETLDAADGNVLFSKTITGVTLQRNRLTTLTGAIYSSANITASSFQIDGAWLDGNNVNF